MVKRLPEAVGVVPEVGAEDVGQRVTFGFEHKSVTAVVVEDLIDRSGGAVGRDEEEAERRFLGRLQVRVLLLGGLVAGFLDAVVLHLCAVEVAHLLVDGLDQASAEREPALAGGGRCRDEQKEVGIDRLAVVNAVEFIQAGGPANNGTDYKDIGIGVGAGIACHFVEESGQVAVEFLGEGWHRFRRRSFHQSITSISSIR